MPSTVTISIFRHAKRWSRPFTRTGASSWIRPASMRHRAASRAIPAFSSAPTARKIELGQTKHGATKDIIIHVPLEGQPQPAVGEKLVLHIDWPRRYKLMRMHTACHLLSVVCSFPITGAAVGEDESRVDFDMSRDDRQGRGDGQADGTRRPEPSGLSAVDHRRGACRQSRHRQIEECSPADAALAASASSASARIPRLTASPAAAHMCPKPRKSAQIHIAKIEKKGKENRRFRIRFGAPGDEA